MMINIYSGLRKLIVFLCASAVTLIVLGLVLKQSGLIQTFDDIIHFGGTPFVGTYSDYLQFTLASNSTFLHKKSEFEVTYKINNLGYRGTYPQHISKPDDTKRLLMLGDSMTFGWGNTLENTFVQQMQNALDDQYEQRWEVINAGYHDGHSPDSYYAYLLKEGLILEPDVVVIVLYSDNDIRDIERNLWLETNEQGAPKRIQSTILYPNHEGDILYPPAVLEQYLPWNYRIPFLRNSYSLVGISQLINHITGIRRLDQPFSWKRHSKEEGWRRFIILLNAHEVLSQNRQYELFFVLTSHDPDRQAQDPGADAKIAQMLSENPDRSWLDLRPFLDGGSYYPKDGHFNARGSAMAAEKILEYLRTHSKQIGEDAA